MNPTIEARLMKLALELKNRIAEGAGDADALRAELADVEDNLATLKDRVAKLERHRANISTGGGAPGPQGPAGPPGPPGEAATPRWSFFPQGF